MPEESSDRISELKTHIQQLFDDQTTVQEILQELDNNWKRGKNIRDDIDRIRHRFDAMSVVFDYILRSKRRRSELLDQLGIADTDEARFLESLVSKYSALDDPLLEAAYYRTGVLNHLKSFGTEDYFYDPVYQMVLVQFSVYTETKRLMQVRNHVDDIIWLADSMIEVCSRALHLCSEKQSPIAKDYIGNLKERLKSLEESFKDFQNWVNSYPDAENEEYSTGAVIGQDVSEDQLAESTGQPVVDISSEE
jgi:hypothetical protein